MRSDYQKAQLNPIPRISSREIEERIKLFTTARYYFPKMWDGTQVKRVPKGALEHLEGYARPGGPTIDDSFVFEVGGATFAFEFISIHEYKEEDVTYHMGYGPKSDTLVVWEEE